MFIGLCIQTYAIHVWEFFKVAAEVYLPQCALTR
jgi:hypothetical protein